MSTVAQVDENLASAERSGPGTLSAEELLLLEKVAGAFKGLQPIPCTECRYCMPCPSGVNIPHNLSMYNKAVMYDRLADSQRWYADTKPAERASACTDCDQCEEKCPQKITISDWMPRIDRELGPGRSRDRRGPEGATRHANPGEAAPAGMCLQGPRPLQRRVRLGARSAPALAGGRGVQGLLPPRAGPGSIGSTAASNARSSAPACSGRKPCTWTGSARCCCRGLPEEAVRAWPPVSVTVPASPASVAIPWPVGEAVVPVARGSGIDTRKVEAVVGRLFDDRGRRNPLRTRAVLVVQDGRIICERYAPGFGPDTRLLSWSMAKSVVSVLVGILAGQGKLRIDEPAPVPEWADERDPRHAITVSQLLRMCSGLAWTETYGEQPISDVNQMLFFEPDMARFAAGQPPASTARHSLALLIRQHEHHLPAHARPVREREDYLAFPHRALFDRIGMRSAVWGTDASGTLVGSSYLYATARDFARFGMFCLADGVWQGKRILPEGWMTWATTPTPTDPSAEYGAGFWLNRDPVDATRTRAYPKLPADFFYANGHQGQMIGVIPSRKLVVVRLGMTWGSEWGREEFLAEMLGA